MTQTEATFGVFTPGVLEVLSIGKGDLTLEVDPSNPEDTETARMLIEEMLRKGYAIYVDTAWGPIRVREFNATSMTYTIDVPTEGLVEQPVTTASEPVVTEKHTTKRAPRSRRERVPVAGSRATAVGRTAGG